MKLCADRARVLRRGKPAVPRNRTFPEEKEGRRAAPPALGVIRFPRGRKRLDWTRDDAFHRARPSPKAGGPSGYWMMSQTLLQLQPEEI